MQNAPIFLLEEYESIYILWNIENDEKICNGAIYYSYYIMLSFFCTFFQWANY